MDDMQEAIIYELVEKYVNIWLDNIQTEIDFWNSYFFLKGGRSKWDYKRRSEGTLTIAPHNEEFIDYTDKNFRVLDAGSGPISNFGIMGHGGKVNLTACDALAEIYGSILKNFGITPYCTTEFGCFEGLSQIYKPNQFDYVHVSNSLDHCFDPVLGVYNLITVVKNNKYIHLRHRKNEAENANYTGLHQWNFTVENSEFLIWNKKIHYNITKLFKNCCDFSYRTTPGSNDVVVIIKKNVDYMPFEILYNSFYLINKGLIKKAFEHRCKLYEKNYFQNLRKKFQENHAVRHSSNS